MYYYLTSISLINFILLSLFSKEKITAPDIKKRVCDMLEFDGKHHFSTFENKDSKKKFISDMLVK